MVLVLVLLLFLVASSPRSSRASAGESVVGGVVIKEEREGPALRRSWKEVEVVRRDGSVGGGEVAVA